MIELYLTCPCLKSLRVQLTNQITAYRVWKLFLDEHARHIDGFPAEKYIVCPSCNDLMQLRNGPWGFFYTCNGYPRCTLLWKADEQGFPIGEPADAETRKMRKIAHDMFDRLWKENIINRTRAYEWLCAVLHKSKRDGHIGMLNIGECRRLITLIELDFPRLRWDD